MKYLVDAHALIWYSDHHHLLSSKAKTTIMDPVSELLVSSATIWEIAIKAGLNKLKLSGPFLPWINRLIGGLCLKILPIEILHADKQASLPPYHGDPFDRMLVAQSLTEQVGVISADSMLDRYGITRIW